MINGVIVKPLDVHVDDRGYLMELLHIEDPDIVGFSQVYVSKNNPSIIRAWHWHEQQTDHWICLSGHIKVGLFDRRIDSLTNGESMSIVIGEDNKKLVIIPPGVMHGYMTIGVAPSLLLNFTDFPYNLDDEFRKVWKFDPPGIEDFWEIKYT